jgi:hypothetical protein
MNCNRCGEPAVVARGEERLCGGCAVRADWENVARIAQGLVVREAIAAPAPAPSNGEGPGDLAPADPFAG